MSFLKDCCVDCGEGHREDVEKARGLAEGKSWSSMSTLSGDRVEIAR